MKPLCAVLLLIAVDVCATGVRDLTLPNIAASLKFAVILTAGRAICLSTMWPGRWSRITNSAQLAWIERALQQSNDDWKICYFHHPLYSDGKTHGSQVDLRAVLEPILVKYGVNVVLSGHDHVYERIKPQKGITYFVSGASGQLRKGDVRRSDMTAAEFDQDRSFMLVDVSGDDLFFQAISRTGTVVDSGVLHRQPGT